jgi:hypothetical protein
VRAPETCPQAGTPSPSLSDRGRFFPASGPRKGGSDFVAYRPENRIVSHILSHMSRLDGYDSNCLSWSKAGF